MESGDPDIDAAIARRAEHVTVLIGHVATLRQFLDDDDKESYVHVKAEIEKITIAKDLHNRIVSDLRSICRERNVHIDDLDERERNLDVDCANAIEEAQQWIIAVKSIKARVAHGKKEDASGGEDGEGYYRVIVDSQREVIEDQKVRLQTMEDLMKKLEEQVQHLNAKEGEVDHLRSAMDKQQQEHNRVNESYSRTICDLREELRKKEEEDESFKPRGSSTLNPGRRTSGLGEGTFGQEEMYALSHVMQKSNVDLVKSVLDDTHEKQKKFYMEIRAPKVELRKFSGDMTKYHPFISRFDDVIGDTDCSYSVKLNTLVQNCSEAVQKHLICCDYLKPQEGYELARSILKKKYGKTHLIVHSWMEKLMSYPKLKEGDALQNYVSDIKSAKKTLESMDSIGELDNSDKKLVLISKLPSYIQHRWRKRVRESNEGGRSATLEELITIVEEAADEQSDPIYGVERVTKVINIYESQSKPTGHGGARKKTQQSHAMVHGETAEDDVVKTGKEKSSSKPPGRSYQMEKCACCKLEHFTRQCEDFKKMTSKEKLLYVRKNNMCELCLSTRHQVNDCAFTWRCQIAPCKGKHNNALHWAITDEKARNENTKVMMTMMVGLNEENRRPPISRRVKVDTLEAGKPLFNYSVDLAEYAVPVVPVSVYSFKRSTPTYALIDTGGGFTIMTRSFFEKTGLTPTLKTTFKLETITGGETVDADLITCRIKGKGQEQGHLMFNAVVLDKKLVDPKYADVLKTVGRWPHLRRLKIPTHDSNSIDLLIGQDNAHLFKGRELVEDYLFHSPHAQRTPLGWMINGLNMDDSSVPVCKVSRLTMMKRQEEQLHVAVERMNKLDEVPEKPQWNAVDQQIIETWNQEARLTDDGHVELPIPIKNGKLNLPNNFEGVKKRHEALGRRLQRNDELKKLFMEETKKNENEGYVEKITDEAEPGGEWYVPTQAVISDRKPGRCRIVGDISYTQDGHCLNTAVHQGPNLTADIVDIMIKFRKYRYAVTGDISGMYNQTRVPEKQRNCLRFLSWENHDPTQEITKYRMVTHMFGATWAPAAAIFALRWVAERLGSEYHIDVIDTILKHFYVDDMLRSIMTEEGGVRMLTGVRELLKKGSFSLVKIGSNSLRILNSVPVEDRAKPYEDVRLELNDDVKDTTLGSVWRPKQDELSFRTINPERPKTRRGMLSTMTSLYDPLGMVSPYILMARMLLQQVCKLGYDWDDELPETLQKRWNEWIDGLDEMKKFAVPRWIGITDRTDVTYKMHIFSDASEEGYGTVIYFCTKNEDGEVVNSVILAAKSRVAPMKFNTIPRLELAAAVLAVKMERMMMKYLDMKMEPSQFWTDSTVVLHYINGDSWEYKTFVANRVAYIQENTLPTQWRHVRGEDNIADVTSRGLTGEELMKSKEWTTGPQFLKSVEDWPEEFKPRKSMRDETQMELKKRMMMTMKIKHEDEEQHTRQKMLEKRSRWNRLIRDVCVLRRFVGWLRMKRMKINNGGYTASEVEYATEVVIRLTQRQYLTEGQRSSRMFEKLYPFSSDGIMRVGGRLMFSALIYEEKHPAIIPRSPTLTAYIAHIHERIGHGGVDRTYYEARRHYWILGGKNEVKRVINGCVWCRRLRGKPGKQLMAPLPTFRVTETKVPFDKVGVDYFGPMYVKVGRGQQKRWACIFTDLVMRAAHVEIIPDMTATGFMNAFQRFISRRGKPSLVVSDNGTNFVGSVREMKEEMKRWNEKKIATYMSEENVVWKFNTPTASHHGGAWERLIRVFRAIFLSLVKEQALTDEKLTTYSCIAESVMNSRPLTKLTENPDDPLPLTPNHFLQLRQAKGIAGDYQKSDVLRRRWQQLQYLGDLFWKRWSREYLKTMMGRQKWTKETMNLKKGRLVLMMDESLPRLNWPLALIVDVVEGRDGKTRSVKLRTERGEFLRPITKIIPLECE